MEEKADLADLLKEADDVLADLRQADNDIVGVDVAEGGVVPALPPRLGQHQIPAVYRRQKVLVFPEEQKMRKEEMRKNIFQAGDKRLHTFTFV